MSAFAEGRDLAGGDDGEGESAYGLVGEGLAEHFLFYFIIFCFVC